MLLRKNIDEVLERTGQFCNTTKKTGALIHVKSVKSIKMPSTKPLNRWNFPGELYDYLDMRIEELQYFWERRAGVDDDYIPCLAPEFGIAEHVAFIKGDVHFTENTSWINPVISTWSDLKKLELREDNIWFRMVMDGLSYLREKSEGRFAVKFRGADAPMDIANQLRGNTLMTDFFDYPEQVHEMMEFCVEAAIWTLANQKKVIKEYNGGFFSGFSVWMPGNSTGHLSDDLSTMCSPGIYRTFGLPYLRKVCKDYDHVYMHTHSLGQHILPDILTVKNIDFVDIVNDPKCPRGIEVYKQNEAALKGRIVVVNMTLDEITNNLEFLKRNKTVIWYEAADIRDALAAVETVRRELA